MQRYAIYAGVGFIHPVKWDSGDWVRFSEAQAEIERLGNRIHELEACVVDLLKAQARFVPCSERLPDHMDETLVQISTPGRGPMLAIAWCFPSIRWIIRDEAFKDWTVVSWLDNLPPLDGGVRIKGDT